MRCIEILFTGFKQIIFPVDQIKSSVSTAEYITKLKQEKTAASLFSRKRIIIASAVIVLIFLILLFKSGDILNLLGIG